MATVTRFAPSPTGRLHIGHAFSALFGFRRARDAGGTFILRKASSTKSAPPNKPTTRAPVIRGPAATTTPRSCSCARNSYFISGLKPWYLYPISWGLTGLG